MHLVTVGGSDAGICAALRARELDPAADVTVVVADAYPNFSICGIPYYVSGEVTHWRNLAHRTHADLEATGMRLRRTPPPPRSTCPGNLIAVRRRRQEDRLRRTRGRHRRRPGPPTHRGGWTGLGPADGVHLLHSMGDTFALTRSLDTLHPTVALIVGAGYVGLEMAEGLTSRGLHVTQVEMLPEVLPTVDPELGALVHTELDEHGVDVHTHTTVTAITRTDPPSRPAARRGHRSRQPTARPERDLVLVVVGVRPDTDLLAAAGADPRRAAPSRSTRHGYRTATRMGRG